MGLDLKLIPASRPSIECDHSGAIMQFHRDGIVDEIELWAKEEAQEAWIKDIATPLKNGKPLKKDEYGNKLTYVTADQLIKWAKNNKNLITDRTNKAIFAYLKCLEKRTPIYLYWS